jgi:hypothetical protein
MNSYYKVIDCELYVRSDYAIQQMNGCSNDTVKLIAEFIKCMRPDDNELYESILKVIK